VPGPRGQSYKESERIEERQQDGAGRQGRNPENGKARGQLNDLCTGGLGEHKFKVVLICCFCGALRNRWLP
jgi:hypothetical protein